MARKQKIQLQQPQDLEAIDAELAAAMDALDQKNGEVAGLLAEYAPPLPDPESATAAEPGAGACEPQPGENAESP